MKCQKCGASNPADGVFCSDCGAKLAKGEERSSNQEAPAQQAGKIAKKFKSLVAKLSRGEKLVAIGAIVGFISFFLPWLSLDKNVAKNMDLQETMSGQYLGGWIWLLPILMLVSLTFLYFSIGAPAKTKIKYSAYHILIGTIFATMGIVLMALMSRVEKWFLESVNQYGKETIFSFGIGTWLLILGSLAIIVGAFLNQRENLKE